MKFTLNLLSHTTEVLFGKSLDNPECLAKTVLCYMIKCLYGGPEFIAKILPVSQLTADFILHQVQPIVGYQRRCIVLLDEVYIRICYHIPRRYLSENHLIILNGKNSTLLYDQMSLRRARIYR